MSTMTVEPIEREQRSDIDEPTRAVQAPQLRKGTYRPDRDDGGCGMNVVSVYSGEVKITDYPSCAAPPLSRLVQILNDDYADEDGLLAPTESNVVLAIAALTVGTGSSSMSVVRAWVAEVLSNPSWGMATAPLDPSSTKALNVLAEALSARARGRRLSRLQLARLQRQLQPIAQVPDLHRIAECALQVLTAETVPAAHMGAERIAEIVVAHSVSLRQFTTAAIWAWRHLAGVAGADVPTLTTLHAAARKLLSRTDHAPKLRTKEIQP